MNINEIIILKLPNNLIDSIIFFYELENIIILIPFLKMNLLKKILFFLQYKNIKLNLHCSSVKIPSFCGEHNHIIIYSRILCDKHMMCYYIFL